MRVLVRNPPGQFRGVALARSFGVWCIEIVQGITAGCCIVIAHFEIDAVLRRARDHVSLVLNGASLGIDDCGRDRDGTVGLTCHVYCVISSMS